MRRLIARIVVVMLVCAGSASFAGSSTQWCNSMYPNERVGGLAYGALPGYQDGYDGQAIVPYTERPGVYLQFFRANGPGWAGPTAFYADDIESPIPDGGSKTWWDICLWSYDYTPILGDRAGIVSSWVGIDRAPAGYTGILRIDYVPAHLNWDGPYEFRIDLTKTSSVRLPCPITDDPFNLDNVTRMHLTVYTSVPEPSSLAAMAAALAGLGVLRRRR